MTRDPLLSYHDVPSILETQPARNPDTVCFLMRGARLTYGSMNARANAFAHGLASIEVGPGQIVAMLMKNAPEFLFAWFGILKLGAIQAPINVETRGKSLAHQLNLCKAETIIADCQFLAQIIEIADQLAQLKRVVVRDPGSAIDHDAPFEILDFDAVFSDSDGNPDRPPADPLAPAMVMFTSGTTGLSKGCVLSHSYLLHHCELVEREFQVTKEDTLYCPFPLFHADAAYLTVLPAFYVGGRAALSERFSASRFWDEVREFGATVFDFMGATLTILWKQDPKPDDLDNTVRLAWGVPMPDFAEAFEKRFGLRLVEVYGLTDGGVGVYQPLDEPRRPGACGKPVDSYQFKIFSPSDQELPVGETGEIVIRPNRPGVVMNEYLNMPAETLATMRNLWLHTGDFGFFDADGYLHFVGRAKDSIRRRGENISAFELEEAVGSHPAVLNCAAIGVPSELTEDDVMVFVVLKPGQTLTHEALTNHCRQTVAEFMVPRYIRFVPDQIGRAHV